MFPSRYERMTALCQGTYNRGIQLINFISMTVVKTIRIIAVNALRDNYLAKFYVRIVTVMVDIIRA